MAPTTTSKREAAVRDVYATTEADRAKISALRVGQPVEIDGRLDKLPWASVPRSDRFVDMVTGEPGLFDTRVAATWDRENLYVAYWVEQPFLRSHVTERDALVWYDHGDVELFIAGPDSYYELQVNPRGTIYEVLHIWADACTPGGRFDRLEFDPRRRNARGFTGNGDPSHWDWDGLHPRGNRWAFLDWDLPGLRVAVQLEGTLNDDRDVDRGWTAEIAVPWESVSLLSGERADPAPGDIRSCCFARFENLAVNGRPVRPVTGWTLNRHGRYDIHAPELWPLVELSEELVPEPSDADPAAVDGPDRASERESDD